MRRNFGLSLLLAVVTLVTFWPVGRLGFIFFDDWDYVVHNQHVNTGVSEENLVWALTAAHASNWHPITWMSHMIDCDLFGLNPAGPHWVNLGFHTANVILLFFWLQRLTGTRWRSFLVAALFACHPLHIQSIAWISERKDVLSGFFALLTLIAYTEYCRKNSAKWYILALTLFALGLMAKPMLVMLPFVLLLLDYWPLNRIYPIAVIDSNELPRAYSLSAMVEKMPFFILSLGSCIITLWAQRLGNSILTFQELNWHDRAIHAVLAYSLYLKKLFWPTNLAIFYPYTRMAHIKMALMMAVPCIFSCVCLLRSRVQPYLAVGWFWFVATLIPVIGLIQVGMQTIADRYMYLPSIGLFIALAWAMAEFAERRPMSMIQIPKNIAQRSFRTSGSPSGLKLVISALAVVLLAVCLVDTRWQLTFWKDDISLFKRVVEVTPSNTTFGYDCLGYAYFSDGDLQNAAQCYAKSIASDANYILSREHLGQLLMRQNKFSEAEFQFRAILKAHPEYHRANNLLGITLVKEKRDAEAETEFEIALKFSPDDRALLGRLAIAKQRAEAENTLSILAKQYNVKPTASTEAQMGQAESLLENFHLAKAHYENALILDSDAVQILNNLAWLLATCPDSSCRDGKQAVELAKRACELTKYQETIFIGTLAAAFARNGEFDQAVATAQKACSNAMSLNETKLLNANQNLLNLYLRHQAFEETSQVGN